MEFLEKLRQGIKIYGVCRTAVESGISKASVSRFANESQNLTIDKLKKIEQVLNAANIL
jgi:transcriptional regulator with XRE-family HTH domain